MGNSTPCERVCGLAETAPAILWASDEQGRCTFVNEGWAELSGRPTEAAFGQGWMEIIHPEDLNLIRSVNLPRIKSHQPFDVEYRVRAADGQYRWILDRGRPRLNKDGTFAGYAGACVDITDRKQAEESLRLSEERFRVAAECATDVIYEWNVATGLIDYYGTPTTSFRLQPEDRPHDFEAWKRRLHPEDAPRILQAIQDHLASGEPVREEYRVVGSDGTIFDVAVRATPLRDSRGAVYKWIGAATDITSQKEIDRQYRELVENASDIIYCHDLQGRFLSVNSAAERLTGYAREEAHSITVADVVARGDLSKVQNAIDGVARGQNSKEPLEFEIRAKDGRPIFLEVTASPLVRNGAVVGVQGIARDITDRRRIRLLETDRRNVLELIAQNWPLDVVLERILIMVRNQYPNLVGSISLVKDGKLHLAARSLLPESCVNVADGAPVGPVSTPAAASAYWRRPVVVEDILADRLWERFREPAEAAGFRACAAIPIISGAGRVLGTVEVHYQQPHQPGEAEMDLLDTAARLAALAVEHRELTDQLAYQAHHDVLTGLPNRILFDDRLRQALALARREGHSVGLFFLDLDRFKFVNDRYGHSVGDTLLREVAKRLRHCLRESDTLARAGGDEFTALLPSVREPLESMDVAQRMLDAMAEPFMVGGHELFVTASLGAAFFPADGTDANTLSRNADTAMYAAKSRGKNRVEAFCAGMNLEIRERLDLESELHRALERGEFALVYQPQFALSTGALIGFEALLRWHHPKLGAVPPDRFIPIAEDCGLMTGISLWSLGEACRQIQTWKQKGYPPLKIALNLSAVQFSSADLADSVAEVLAKHGLEPAWLEIELTESLVMRDAKESARQMARLRNLGVTVSIDDFGTGYSSLSRLQSLPIQNLKIDQSFVQALDHWPDAHPHLVEAILALAHSLGMKAVAEGVETSEQLQILQGLGCDAAQGFLLGKPKPAAEMEDLLEAEKARAGRPAPPQLRDLHEDDNQRVER